MQLRRTSSVLGVAAIVSIPAAALASTLYGISGDGATTNAETLFTLNTSTSATTLVTALGNGIDGESLAFNPNDGLLYHLSGRGVLPGALNSNTGQIFESINPATLSVTPILLQGGGFNADDAKFTEEAQGFVFNPATGNFLVTDRDRFLYSLTPGGVVTPLGPEMNHLAKGLAFVGSTLYSLDNDLGDPAGARLRQIDPATGATIGAPISISVPAISIVNGISLATDPDTNVLYAVLRTTDVTPGVRILVTLDPATGAATLVGPLDVAIATIAFIPEPAALGLFGVLGLLLTRRRQ